MKTGHYQMESSEKLQTEVCDKLTACENIKDTSAADNSDDMETDPHRYPEKIIPNTLYKSVSHKRKKIEDNRNASSETTMTNKKIGAITKGSTHTWEWSHISKFTPKEIAFTDEEKVNIALPDNPNPYDYFSLYLTDTIMEYTMKETNLYAEQFLEKNKTNLEARSNALNWNSTDPNEVKTFIGLIVLMGLL